MKDPFYISIPATHLPSQKINNQQIIDRVKTRYRGNANNWRRIERGIKSIFDRCNSNERYFDEGSSSSIGEVAA